MKKILSLSLLTAAILVTSGCDKIEDIVDDYLKTAVVVIENGTQNPITISAEGTVTSSNVVDSGKSNVQTLLNEDTYDVTLTINGSDRKTNVSKDRTTILGVSAVNQNIVTDYNVLSNNVRTNVMILNLSDVELTSSNVLSLEIIMKDGSIKHLVLPASAVPVGAKSELTGNGVQVNLNDVESINGEEIASILSENDVDPLVAKNLSKLGNMDFAIVVKSLTDIKVVPLVNPADIELL